MKEKNTKASSNNLNTYKKKTTLKDSYLSNKAENDNFNISNWRNLSVSVINDRETKNDIISKFSDIVNINKSYKHYFKIGFNCIQKIVESYPNKIAVVCLLKEKGNI